MKKFVITGVFLLFLAPFALNAQTISNGDLFGTGGSSSSDSSAQPSASPGAKKKGAKGGADQPPQGPTIITAMEGMDYDEKTRVAIFYGSDYGVFVQDPSFTVNCEKLTALMKKSGTPATSASRIKGAPTPKPTPVPAKGKTSAADAASQRGSGLQRAIAEGAPDRPVVIVQDKPAAAGQQPVHNVGIAEKADYNADTGDVVLTGWPRVSQLGGNTQIATSPATVMTMNKNSNKMTTRGPSRTEIQEQNAKKSGTDAGTSDATSSPSPQ